MPLPKTHDALAAALECEPQDLGESRASTNRRDYTGQTVGKLEVIKQAGLGKNSLALWECKCECGNTVVRSSHYLHNTKSPQCDKCPRRIKLGKVYKDIVGKIYGWFLSVTDTMAARLLPFFAEAYVHAAVFPPS